MKDEAKFLLKSTRPRITFALFLGVVMGLVKSSSLGIGTLAFSAVYMFLQGFAVFSLNDYFDRDTDSFRGSNYLKGVDGNREERRLLLYAASVSIASLLLISYLVSETVFLLTLGIITLSVLYSAPPVRLKSKPPLDVFANVVGILGLFSIGLSVGSNGFSLFPEAYWMAVLAGGFHAVASLPDIDADRKAGLKTTGMVLGWRKTLGIEILILIASFIFISWSAVSTGMLLIFLSYLVYMYLHPEEESFYTGIRYMVPLTMFYAVIWIAVSV